MSQQHSGNGQRKATGSTIRSAVQQMRIAHCQTLGSCAELLHQHNDDFAADAATLLQIFTALSERLATIELATGRNATIDGDEPAEAVSHRVGKDSLAISSVAIQEGDAGTNGGSAHSSPRRGGDNATNGQHPPFSLPHLRRMLNDVADAEDNAESPEGEFSMLKLVRGGPATKVNQRNLHTSSVHLFLSLEGATQEEPGCICARKKDGSYTYVRPRSRAAHPTRRSTVLASAVHFVCSQSVHGLPS